MEKDKLVGLKRIRNLDGITFIGEKTDGTRVEIEKDILTGFIKFLENIDAETMKVEEKNRVKLMDEITKVLTIPNYSTVIA